MSHSGASGFGSAGSDISLGQHGALDHGEHEGIHITGDASGGTNAGHQDEQSDGKEEEEEGSVPDGHAAMPVNAYPGVNDGEPIYFGFSTLPVASCHALPGAPKLKSKGRARLNKFEANLEEEEMSIALEHIAFATAERPSILSDAGLGIGLKKYFQDAPSTEKRQLIRDVLLIEAAFLNKKSTKSERKQLLNTSEDELRQLRARLLQVIKNGPCFVRGGAAQREGFKQVPLWLQAIGDQEVHFACDTLTGSIGFWTQEEINKFNSGFPIIQGASQHCKLAWMVSRHFGIGGIPDKDFQLGSHSLHERINRFVGGMIRSNAPPYFTDESGHFYENYTKKNAQNVTNEARFLEVIAAVDPTAKLYHNGVCSAGMVPCPGHSLTDNPL
jgi:hypothetical protein